MNGYMEKKLYIFFCNNPKTHNLEIEVVRVIITAQHT